MANLIDKKIKQKKVSNRICICVMVAILCFVISLAEAIGKRPSSRYRGIGYRNSVNTDSSANLPEHFKDAILNPVSGTNLIRHYSYDESGCFIGIYDAVSGFMNVYSAGQLVALVDPETGKVFQEFHYEDGSLQYSEVLYKSGDLEAGDRVYYKGDISRPSLVVDKNGYKKKEYHYDLE